METREISDEALLNGLRDQPRLRSRIAGLLELAQGSKEELERADDAEDWLIQEVRALGQETLQAWAQSRVHQSEEDVRHSGRAHRRGKKN